LKAADKTKNKKEAGMTFGSKVFGSKKAYVFDTSALMEYPQVLKYTRRHSVVLPVVVMRELEGLKNHERQDVAARARLASHYLERYAKKITIADWKDANHLEALGSRADNMIVGTATRLKRRGVDATLVSTDRNMRIVARSYGVKNHIPRPWYRQPALYWSIIAIPFIALGLLVANAVSTIWSVKGFLYGTIWEEIALFGGVLALPAVFVFGILMTWMCGILPDEISKELRKNDGELNNVVFNPVLSGFETNVWYRKGS